MAQRGRKKVPGNRTRSKKKDVDGNYLRGRPSFDPSAPTSNDGKQLEQMVESISFSEFKAPFNRDKLPEFFIRSLTSLTLHFPSYPKDNP